VSPDKDSICRVLDLSTSSRRGKLSEKYQRRVQTMEVSSYSSVGTMPSSNLSDRFKDLNFSIEAAVSFPNRISFSILTNSVRAISHEKKNR
jgi:hypothetical protein